MAYKGIYILFILFKCCCRVIFIFTWISSTEAESSYEIRQFRDAPGIYYEEIGTVSIFSDTWNLAIHLNLEFLAGQEKRTINNLLQLQNTCITEKNNDTLCEILTQSVDHLVEKVKENIGILHDLVGAEHCRRRRGLIDGLGSVIKSITGNMDASDAERIAAELNTFRINERIFKSGIKKQTHVIESAIHLFNRTSYITQQNQEAIGKILHATDVRLTKATNELQSRHLLSESIAAIEVHVEALLGDVKDLVEMFSSISTGTVNPAFLSPEKFTEYLTEALPHIPRGKSFPRPVTRDNALHLLRLTTVKAYRQGSIVVVLLEVPLVGKTDFSLNQVFPLPRKMGNNTFYYLETSEDLVIVNRESQSYLRMTHQELEKCKKDEEKYYCSPQHPILLVNEEAPCEVIIYNTNNVNDEHQCSKKFIKFKRSIIMPLIQPGRWIFVSPIEETLLISCEGLPSHQEVMHGTGLIKLDGKCIVTGRDFRVETVRKISQVIRDNSYIPSYNLTLTKLELHNISKVVDKLEAPLLRSIVSSPQELNELGMRLRDISKEVDTVLPSYTQYYRDVGQYSFGGLLLILVLVLFIKQWIWRKCCSHSSTQPALSV